MGLMDAMREDAAATTPEVQGDSLEQLVALAAQQVEIELTIKNLEDELKNAQTQLKKVSEEDIPNKMTELGISEFTLANGAKIKVKPFYSASLSEKNEKRGEAFQWLRENGFDDIIKNEVSVAFGRGEDNRAQATLEALTNMGLEPHQDTSVHASTLKAFIKEQVEAGKAIPLDLFKAYIGRKSTIETPKEKRK